MPVPVSVLLIDRCHVVRAYARQVIEDTTHFHVIDLPDELEALEYARRAEPPPALIVLDWGAAPWSARGTLEEVRAARPEVPVIVVSADPLSRRQALECGAVAFVEKVPGRYMRDLLAVMSEFGRRW